MRWIAAAALIPAAAMAQQVTLDACQLDPESAKVLSDMATAIGSSQWSAVVVLSLVLVTWALRKLGGLLPAPVGTWATSDRGGTVLAIVGGALVTLSGSLMAGAHLSLGLVLQALLAALAAIGAYVAPKRLANPPDMREYQPPPVMPVTGTRIEQTTPTPKLGD